MLNAKAFSSAATLITAVFYIVCATISFIAPDFVSGIASSWIHSLNLEAIKMRGQLSVGTLAYGLITISVLTWITSFAFVELYNRLAKGN
ncbi:MAG: hypothetical protein A2186_03165 [Candidatus Levybacteria bacterium RIFOXYA1_FULL_41_10]|nr:MAG: hypothetical protein UT44_C0015G0025 [Candidatus Levybacteria bacterium GW2011_GWA1_39_32]KKR49839.1 MAG: hypothetical protein UT87_C0024G0007 [Candidatus Levybacteria bacterium GW2011_GWC1_40_19]KKR71925.1 MAG: hypothetical protein UU15_C0039G0003 [Candidatus Levybacteria bacterium GW2011_GWC2_40_7]KKR94759.1 MAG: hypothetical protein UU45_C0007G0007 [Candidatus Levybacteria bacterium GW2011_GWA2_41_15]KKS01034.1 MAG: hypothetical protein UU52_C0020G0007 [Candidatus Levybacteria bacter